MAEQNKVSIRVEVNDPNGARESLQRLGRDGGAALRGLGAAGNEMQVGISNARAALAGFIGGLALGAIGAATSAVREFIGAMRESIAAVADLNARAQQVGIGADALQILESAAARNNVSAGQLEAALARLTARTGEAREGNRAAIESFEQLGVRILDAAGRLRPIEQILGDVAERIAAIDDPARRAEAAIDIFGRAGQRLLPILAQGRQGLRETEDQARSTGLVIDEELRARAEALNARLEQNRLAWQQWRRTMSVEVQEAIVNAVNWLNALGDSIGELTTRLGRRVAIEISPRLVTDTGTIRDQLNRYQAELDQVNAGIANNRAVAETNPNNVVRGYAASAVEQQLQRQRDLTAQILGLRERLAQLEAPADGTRGREGGDIPGFRTRVAPTPAFENGPTGRSNPAARGGGGGREDNALDRAVVGFERQDLQLANQERALEFEARAAELRARNDERSRQALHELTVEREAARRAQEEQLRIDELLAQADVAQRRGQNELAQAYRDQAATVEEAYGRIEAAARRRDAATSPAVVENIRRQEEAVKGLGQAFGTAFENAVFKGGKLRDVIKALIDDILRLAARMLLIQPFQNWLSGAVGNIFGGAGPAGGALAGLGGVKLAALGDAFDRGRVMAFADGGVFDRPTMFGMAGGRLGVMGEAGPEAAMPLIRDRAGRLSVRAIGAGAGTVILNSTVNVTVQGGGGGAEANQSQGEAIARALDGRVRMIFREELETARRPGGALNSSF